MKPGVFARACVLAHAYSPVQLGPPILTVENSIKISLCLIWI